MTGFLMKLLSLCRGEKRRSGRRDVVQRCYTMDEAKARRKAYRRRKAAKAARRRNRK